MKNLAISDIKSTLKKLISQDLDANIDVAEIEDDMSLFDDGIGLDSISIVNLIVLIEKSFEISFEDTEINAQTFETLDSLAVFIESRLAKG